MTSKNPSNSWHPNNDNPSTTKNEIRPGTSESLPTDDESWNNEESSIGNSFVRGILKCKKIIVNKPSNHLLQEHDEPTLEPDNVP